MRETLRKQFNQETVKIFELSVWCLNLWCGMVKVKEKITRKEKVEGEILNFSGEKNVYFKDYINNSPAPP